MKKILFCLLCILPVASNAKVIYRVQQTGSIPTATEVQDTFATKHRFYIGASYDLSIWQDYIGDGIELDGKDEFGFDAMVGFRMYDCFRLEADYMHAIAKWDTLRINTDTVFLNAIVDARIGNLYRWFYKQKLVPYVGAGTGLTWYNGKDKTFKNDTNISLAALAGLAIEMGEYFALDLGYRYVYMFKPNVDVAPGLAPSGHQVRLGARINF